MIFLVTIEKKKPVRFWDQELEDWVEKKEFNPLGFCILCGEPNKYPERWGIVFVCKVCKRTRPNDCHLLNKYYESWFKSKK